MQNEPQQSAQGQSANRELSLSDILDIVIDYWYWFVLSVLICVGATYTYYRTRPHSYTSQGTVVLRNEEASASSSKRYLDVALQDLGYDKNMASLENEMVIMKSTPVMMDAVRRLDLNHQCSRKSLFFKTYYHKDAPLRVHVGNRLDHKEHAIVLSVTPLDANSYEYRIESSDLELGSHEHGKANFKESVALGSEAYFEVDKTPYYKAECYGRHYRVAELPVLMVARQLKARVGINRMDKNSDIVLVGYTDNNANRSLEVVDSVMAAYNQLVVNDKMKVVSRSEQFIADRIRMISGDLDDVDSRVEILKRNSQLPDIDGAGSQLLTTGTRYSDEVSQLETESTLVHWISDYVKDPANKDELIPADVAVRDAGVQGLISNYNSELLQYQKVKNTAGANNPTLKKLKQQVDATYLAVVTSLGNLENSIDVRLRKARSNESRTRQKISDIPTQSKAVTEVVRQQKIKEELYLYLLSKREENALSLAVSKDNAKIVEAATPMGSGPHLSRYLMFGLALGLAIPAGVIFLSTLLQNTVKTPLDITNAVDIPILGQVPYKVVPAGTVSKIYVSPTGTDAVNEAFRILASNIPFFMKDMGMKSIQLVSTMPDEGKTTLTLNLAMSLAFMGKRVVLVDIDARKRSLTKELSNGLVEKCNGLLACLAANMDPSLVVSKSTVSDNLDFVLCEKTPPNSPQLLLGEQFDKLDAYLRVHYDYVLYDSTPAPLLADAAIANRVADMTIYVIRHGKVRKRFLSSIREMSESGRFKNMCFVMSQMPMTHKRYGYGSYGYGSYGYGYGGYGYSDSEI